MGKYDDISDQLVQYVSRITPAATVDGNENESVPNDALLITNNQRGEEKDKITDMKISENQPKVRQKVCVYIVPHSTCHRA